MRLTRERSSIMRGCLNGITSSGTCHYQKAYHISNVQARASTKVTFSSSCVMAEVCLDGAHEQWIFYGDASE